MKTRRGICATADRVLAVFRRTQKRAAGERGFGMVETVMAMTLFVAVGTTIAGVLTSSIATHRLARGRTLAEQSAMAQIEVIRALPYTQVGTVNGNPAGTVQPTQSISLAGLTATLTVKITYVNDPVKTSYDQTANYKQVMVTVTRNSDGKQLALETTYIAPPTKQDQASITVNAVDIVSNTPVSGVGVALGTGPSAPRTDTTDSTGSVAFLGLKENPTSGGQQYYTLGITPPGTYVEPSGIDTLQTNLTAGQPWSTIAHLYQPATIYANLTYGGLPYTGAYATTVTLTPTTGTPSSYTIPAGTSSATIPAVQPSNAGVGATFPAPGQYTMTATTADGMTASAAAQLVPNAYPTDLTSTYTLALIRPTVSLKVTVTQNTLSTVGASLTLSGGPNSISVGPVSAGAGGVYTFTNVPVGNGYTVAGTANTVSGSLSNVTVSAPSTSVTLSINPPPSVQVTATQNGFPAAGATITLTGPASYSASGTADSNGVYTFLNVPVASGYTATATALGQSKSQSGITVTAATVTPVSLAIPSVGAISVTATQNGAAAANASLTLKNSSGTTVATGTADSSGAATFSNVLVGTGYVVSGTSQGQSASSSATSVTAGNTSPATVAFPASLGTVTVTVTYDGAVKSGATVTLKNSSGTTVGSGTTNTSGVISFASVPVGTGYTVTATSTTYSNTVSGVAVTYNTVTPVSDALYTGVLAVTVKKSSGSVCVNAQVTLSGGPNGLAATVLPTNSSGIATFSNLPRGATVYTAVATSGTASKSGTKAVTVTGTTALTLTFSSGTPTC